MSEKDYDKIFNKIQKQKQTSNQNAGDQSSFGKSPKKSGKKIARKTTIAIASVVLCAFLGILIAGNVASMFPNLLISQNTQKIEENKNLIKATYEKAGISLDDEDIIVSNDDGNIKLEVSDKKVNEAKQKTQSTLDQINMEMYGTPAPKSNTNIIKSIVIAPNGVTQTNTVNGDNSNNTDNTVAPDENNDDNNGDDNSDTNNDDNVDDENKDNKDEQDGISAQDVLDKINSQQAIIKGYMDRSLSEKSNEYYCKALGVLLSDMRQGNFDGNYDNHTAFTNKDAYRVLCSLVNTDMLSGGNPDDPENVWKNDALFGTIDMPTTLQYNNILEENYNKKFESLALLVEDQSKEFMNYGDPIKNSYLAVVDGYNVYLDYSLNVMDVEQIK